MDRYDPKLIEREQRLRAAIAKLPRARLTERTDITDDLMVIKLRPDIQFDFKAGQYCTLGIDTLERAYSIVSAPHEPELEIFIELIPPPDGALTPLMWKLKAGDSMSIRPRAKGIFTLDEKYRKHFMVSTVTGVAPFVSHIREYLHKQGQGHKFYLLQGASYLDEFTYLEELQGLADAHPETIAYVPTVSRPGEAHNSTWTGVRGRCNTIVEEYLDKFGLDKESTLVYACGHPGMIEDVKERLIPKGFNVQEERFWKD